VRVVNSAPPGLGGPQALAAEWLARTGTRWLVVQTANSEVRPVFFPTLWESAADGGPGAIQEQSSVHRLIFEGFDPGSE
jgi:hypothetical protein